MTIQKVFEINEWTNKIDLFFYVNTENLDQQRKYKMLTGRALTDLYPGEELFYSEECDIDTLSKLDQDDGTLIIFNKTFFKTKVEKVFSYGKEWPELPAGYSGYVLCEINNDKLKNLVLCRIINEAK